MNNTNKFKAFRAYQESQRLAPLPPNGTQQRYKVEGVDSGLIWESWGTYTLTQARRAARRWASQAFTTDVRIIARLADGRKLVIP